MKTRIENFAVYCTSSQVSTFTGLDGNSRLNVVNDFYNKKGLEKPAAITVTTTKKGNYLTKDEKIQLQAEYIKALTSGTVTEIVENNFKAVTNPDAVVTFTETLPYNEAIKVFGSSVVAAKMIDGLSVENNEEFHKIRKFNVPANVSINEIPEFIKALESIYTKAQNSK